VPCRWFRVEEEDRGGIVDKFTPFLNSQLIIDIPKQGGKPGPSFFLWCILMMILIAACVWSPSH